MWRLLIAFDKVNRPTWVPLLGALDDAGLLGALELRLVAWDAMAAALAETHDAGRRAVVAVTLKSTECDAVQARLAALADERRPDDLVIAGGPHPTARPEATLRMGFDGVFAGEGEVAFVAFWRLLIAGNDWRAAPNLRFLDGDRLVARPLAPLIDLDQARPCLLQPRMFAPMELTRGCRWQCRYCQTHHMWMGRERHRSVENAVAHGALYQHFIQFQSANALGYGDAAPGRPDTAALVRLLSALKDRSPGMRLNLGNFPAEARPDYVTRDCMVALRPLLDNRVIAIGAQSGSPRLLRTIARGHTVDDVTRAVDTLLETGFVPYVDVIFGLPEESEDEAGQTRRLVMDLTRRNARVRGHVFLPLPGSVFEDARPSPISAATREMLAELARVGAVDGLWEEQRQMGGGV